MASVIVPASAGLARSSQRRASVRIILVVPIRIVPAAALSNLLGAEAEQKEILFARFLSHLDRRAVARAYSQRSIYHEFHIARTARFVPRRRDLVGDVGRRNQPFGERNIVVRQEDDLEPSAYRRVAINRDGQIVDEFDDQLARR